MSFGDLPWVVLVPTVLGAVAIILLALMIGALENRSHRQAWLHIADARRNNHVRTQVLDERESEQDDLLDELDGLPLCPDCARLLAQMSEEDNRGITH